MTTLRPTLTPSLLLDIIKGLNEQLAEIDFAVLHPLALNLKAGKLDALDIQRIARIIASHVGLNNLTFIVATTFHPPDVGGHIELRDASSEVFIEISQDMSFATECVVATLCHEITHKFLHTHDIRYGSTRLENEVLTDIAAVYLGLGKLMLNGCEWAASTSVTENSRTTQISQTLKVGYISREWFSFAYLLIADIAGLGSKMVFEGLSKASKESLMHCKSTHSSWFKPEYQTTEGLRAAIDYLQDAIVEKQSMLASNDLIVRDALNSIADLSKRIRDAHGPLIEESSLIAACYEKENKATKHLSFLERRHSVEHAISHSGLQLESYRNIFTKLEVIVRDLEFAPNATEIVECPSDQTRLRVPSGKSRILVTCASCGYKFVVSTKRVGRLKYLAFGKNKSWRAFKSKFSRSRLSAGRWLSSALHIASERVGLMHKHDCFSRHRPLGLHPSPIFQC